ncbi:MAG TPA: hypothetical protein VFG43_08310 [Geminicoccaceae bacterium]|nr:hypothetical protein [Geminicoccaceae bacterium]
MQQDSNEPTIGIPPTTHHGVQSVLLPRIGHALALALRARIGEGHFGLDGRLTNWQDVLMPGVDGSLLPDGPGGVDGTRLRHPDSAAALAINSFLNWRRCPDLLQLGGETGFRELRFDARCPTGVRGTPPLLDLIAASEQAVVAVTARGSEYLACRQSQLAAAYDRLRTRPELSPWLLLLATIRGTPGRFRHVDLPALLKNALGLGQTFSNRRIKLVYLFWEPVGGAASGPFAAHRRELAELAERVGESSVQLLPQSFDELWTAWQGLAEPPWLREIVARLKERYSVALPEQAGL